MENYIYNLLYSDENGQITTLDEVLLLDEFSQERVNSLIDLLNNADIYIAYQAMLILISWGVEDGLNKVNEFIDNKCDTLIEFEPHRIWGEDNVYDVISDALYISMMNGQSRNAILPILKKILSMYGDHFFESRLKTVLMKINSIELLQDIKNAIQSALENERYYQASQLLPVVTKLDKIYAEELLIHFESLAKNNNRILLNIKESRSLGL